MFPIHILEIFLLGLILLSIFNIVKQVSLETERNGFQLTPPKTQSTHKLTEPLAKLKHQAIDIQTSTTSKSDNLTDNKKILSTTNQDKNIVKAPKTAQTVLNNYIGDFF